MNPYQDVIVCDRRTVNLFESEDIGASSPGANNRFHLVSFWNGRQTGPVS
jgi:hypothetical protein